VSKTFRSGAGEIHALSVVSLTIEKGEFICLIGASGCGKSTLLRLIGGFETPTAGSVKMWDAPITGPRPDRGMVFQDYALFPWLTVRGNIAFGPKARGLPSEGGARRHRSLHRTGGSGEDCRCLSASAFRRHATTRGHCPRPGQRCPSYPDG